KIKFGLLRRLTPSRNDASTFTQMSLRGATLVATWQSRKVVRNGLLRPPRGLAMTSYRHRCHCEKLL
ncbi:MAG: hypothetical protein LN563_05640, partial [Rickettsia endosymbiont of Platyusa sonomae]|nr:hypothetical protein [Rickettsia endosymbiont of Platyusa sonomae]